MNNNGCEMVHWTTLSSIHYLCHYSLKIHHYHVISMTISFISPWNSNDKTDILLKVAIDTITHHPPPPWNRPISCFMLDKRYSIITYFTRIATKAVGTGTSEAVYAIDTGSHHSAMHPYCNHQCLKTRSDLYMVTENEND